MTEEISVWDRIKTFGQKAFRWIVRYPLALIGSVLVIVAASLIMLTGKGDRFNLGGILGALFGQDPRTDRISKANEIPPDRVHLDGSPLPKGEADEKGYVQREVQVLDQKKNPFRDKSKISITDEGEDRKLNLPSGVLDIDVDKVLKISPETYKVIVTNRPSERVSEEDLKYLE